MPDVAAGNRCRPLNCGITPSTMAAPKSCVASNKKVADRGATWSNDEVDTFIDVWREEEVHHQLDGSTRNSHIFNWIIERMAAARYDRTASQCRIKIKVLKREYRVIKDHPSWIKMILRPSGSC